jgi:hypothetical protein
VGEGAVPLVVGRFSVVQGAVHEHREQGTLRETRALRVVGELVALV